MILNYQKRASKLAERVAGKGPLNFVAITTLPSLRYFFNYEGNSYERFCCGILTEDPERNALVVPKLDEQKAEKSAAKSVYAWTDSEGYSKALLSAMLDLKLEGAIIGCELGLNLGQMDSFKAAAGTSTFTAVTEEISSLRQVKDAEELTAIRESAKILAKAYKAIPEILQKGKSESAAAFEIRRFLLEKGSATVDACLVQSGSNSSIPHSEPGSKKIAAGDMIVVDVSCTNASGYFSDFTRTYVMGNAKKEQETVYDAVKKGQADGVTAAVSGRSAEEVDRAARSSIDSSGYGRYFIHRTGHGLGLEVHEPPWINEGNREELERGMVFTVEPGIYVPGKFGVRIEDDVIIEKDAASNITSISHELVKL